MENKTISLVQRRDAKEQDMRRGERVNCYLSMLARSSQSASTRQTAQILLERGSIEQQEAFMCNERRRIMVFIALFLVAVAGYLIYRQFVPTPVRPEPAPPTYEAAGTVTDIQLQSTAFSNDTTVKTTRGVFQVHGSVSATTGDDARIKRDPEGLVKSALCVESKIKADCYPIL